MEVRDLGIYDQLLHVVWEAALLSAKLSGGNVQIFFNNPAQSCAASP